MSEWISIQERKPPFRKTVLLIGFGVGPRHDYTTDPWVGWLSGGGYSRWPHPFDPTHWCEIPPPPAEGE